MDGLGRGGMGRTRVAPAEASFLNDHRGVVIHGDTRPAAAGRVFCFVLECKQWPGRPATVPYRSDLGRGPSLGIGKPRESCDWRVAGLTFCA